MKKRFLYLIFLTLVVAIGYANEKEITIKIYHTSDIHGNFFPFDFIKNRDASGGFARLSTFINEKRMVHGADNLLFIDGGDILQGQPSVYYYNFVDTVSTHLCAEMMNYLGYDVGVVGNHDIETGHAVYDRWISDCNFPVLGANIISTETGKPYLPPYQIFWKSGIKIAVAGMITEAIPAWLPENLWAGLKFEGIVETATWLIPEIKEKENPDIIIALLHSGVDGPDVTDYNENEGMELTLEVPGIDVILCGHDHSLYCDKVINPVGDSILIIDPASRGDYVSEITVKVRKKDDRIINKNVSGSLIKIANIEPDSKFMERFSDEYKITMDYVNMEIGEFTSSINAREAFFGPSAFNDLLHNLQLKLTGADISFVAPLSQSAVIDSGKIYMRDMFNLYKYENLLYTMELTGEEILGAMEYFFALGTNQMKTPEDNLLLIAPGGYDGRYRFVNPSFSFDTAAGLYYTVDVTKPYRHKITVIAMANGKPFEKDKIYKVAINSYQGSGGGGILTEGAGIPKEKLSGRIINATDKDMRFYLAEEIKKAKIVTPEPLYQWKFIPEEWTIEAGKRDFKLLFGE